MTYHEFHDYTIYKWNQITLLVHLIARRRAVKPTAFSPHRWASSLTADNFSRTVRASTSIFSMYARAISFFLMTHPFVAEINVFSVSCRWTINFLQSVTSTSPTLSTSRSISAVAYEYNIHLSHFSYLFGGCLPIHRISFLDDYTNLLHDFFKMFCNSVCVWICRFVKFCRKFWSMLPGVCVLFFDPVNFGCDECFDSLLNGCEPRRQEDSICCLRVRTIFCH